MTVGVGTDAEGGEGRKEREDVDVVVSWDQYYKTDFAVKQLTTTLWCLIWSAKWVQNITYLYLLHW